jgi:crossover junction endodeoxyribonuclease RuvC
MGIDPGLTGAIAILDADRGTLVDMIDVPTYATPTKARKSGVFNHVDTHQVSFLIDQYAKHVALACLEEPGAMPNQGLSSTFRFGHTCGALHGVMAGHYISVVPVKPAAWKAAMGLSTDKDDSRELASRLFPGHSTLWAKKMHNDRAEAALLCVYATRYLTQLIKMARK